MGGVRSVRLRSLDESVVKAVFAFYDLGFLVDEIDDYGGKQDEHQHNQYSQAD